MFMGAKSNQPGPGTRLNLSQRKQNSETSIRQLEILGTNCSNSDSGNMVQPWSL